MLANAESGRIFVRNLIVATIGLILTYAVLHAVMPHVAPTFVQPSLKQSIRLTEQGEMVLLDVLSIQWIVGEAKAGAILDRMQERTQQIRTLIERERRLRETLAQRWQQVMGDDAATYTAPDVSIEGYVEAGDWQRAMEAARALRDSYRDRQPALHAAAAQLGDTLGDLVRIERDQIDDASALSPTQVQSFFWVSPTGSIVEVFLFALFGVLTNLLINSAEYLRTGQFEPAEKWVAWTKLVYGPALAVILVLAIIIGWLDLGDYETRATTLPIAGFMFGYASRRTVALFDRFVGRVLGAATESVTAGPKRIAKLRADALRRYQASLKPRSLREFRSQALDLVRDHVKTSLLSREESRP